jgi:hypothetical protein
LKKVVDETAKLGPGGFSQKTKLRSCSAQSRMVGFFEEKVCRVGALDMKPRYCTAEVCAAALAENPHGSWRCAERKRIVFAAQVTTVPERNLVNVAAEKGGKGPFPADMHIRLLGDAGRTKSIARPPVAQSGASIGNGSWAEKERGLRVRQTRPDV